MANEIAVLKKYMENDTVKQRFNDILGKKSNAFMASVINVTQSSPRLLEADPNSVMTAAFTAAALDLPIDPNLGFAAVVPYKSKGVQVAQFQMMYKGFIQLAIRTGQYVNMDVTEVYKDEVKKYNPITGVLEFNEDIDYAMRDKGQEKDVAGFYAWFELKEGFKKSLYMPTARMHAHGKKYSKTYGYSTGKWKTDFVAMGKKTAIKMLLSKWGILSTEMQSAVLDDQKVYSADGSTSYEDNPQNDTKEEATVIDATFTESPAETAAAVVDAESNEVFEADF